MPKSEYLQINYGGVIQPEKKDFPPVFERVDQEADPYKNTLAEYEPERTTLQESDACQLRCPGCYAKPYLPHASRELKVINPSNVSSHETIIDQLNAHGPELKEMYLLGLEPTLQPERSAQIFRDARSLGLTAVAATNAATSPEKFDAAFTEAVEADQLHRINVSLDSFNRDIHNKLRGRSFAYDRTLEVIKHGVENGLPLQVTMTVWADNYHTILDSVQELYAIGVRGFVFHEGSLEGAPDYESTGVRRIQPYAWRALISKLAEIRDTLSTKGDLEHFVFPFIYFTEDELRDEMIGDARLTDAYFDHVQSLEKGEDTSMPFIACPAVDVPQVYIFGNDGPKGKGTASLCNMHSIGSGAVLAEFNPESKQFDVVKDPAKNQIEQMQASDFLCPALPYVTRDDNPTDKTETPDGNIYHGCRYISNNQMPTKQSNFAGAAYEVISTYYYERYKALKNGVKMVAIDTIESEYVDFQDRIHAIRSII